MADPLAQLSLDELLDIRAALTDVIDDYGKRMNLPQDDVEQLERWEALADRCDEYSNFD